MVRLWRDNILNSANLSVMMEFLRAWICIVFVRHSLEHTAAINTEKLPLFAMCTQTLISVAEENSHG